MFCLVIKGAAHTTRGDRPLRPGHGPDQWAFGVLALPLVGTCSTGCCDAAIQFQAAAMSRSLAQAPERPMAAQRVCFAWSILPVRASACCADGPLTRSPNVFFSQQSWETGWVAAYPFHACCSALSARLHSPWQLLLPF